MRELAPNNKQCRRKQKWFARILQTRGNNQRGGNSNRKSELCTTEREDIDTGKNRDSFNANDKVTARHCKL